MAVCPAQALLGQKVGIRVREAPLRKLQPPNGHCQNGGKGLDPCQDGLGHLFREELSKFKGAFASFWGV